MTPTARALDLVRQYAALSESRDIRRLEHIFTADFASHSAQGTEHGLEALRAFVLGVWEWMPDIEVTIDSIFANQGADGEPWVGAAILLRGTPAGTVRPIAMREVWIFRFRDNRIAERWAVHDEAADPSAP